MDWANFFVKGQLLSFFMIRIFEDEILLHFMNFQKMFRLEELEVAKDDFVRYEENCSRISKFNIVVMWFGLTLFFILQEIFQNETHGFDAIYTGV